MAKSKTKERKRKARAERIRKEKDKLRNKNRQREKEWKDTIEDRSENRVEDKGVLRIDESVYDGFQRASDKRACFQAIPQQHFQKDDIIEINSALWRRYSDYIAIFNTYARECLDDENWTELLAIARSFVRCTYRPIDADVGLDYSDHAYLLYQVIALYHLQRMPEAEALVERVATSDLSETPQWWAWVEVFVQWVGKKGMRNAIRRAWQKSGFIAALLAGIDTPDKILTKELATDSRCNNTVYIGLEHLYHAHTDKLTSGIVKSGKNDTFKETVKAVCEDELRKAVERKARKQRKKAQTVKYLHVPPEYDDPWLRVLVVAKNIQTMKIWNYIPAYSTCIIHDPDDNIPWYCMFYGKKNAYSGVNCSKGDAVLLAQLRSAKALKEHGFYQDEKTMFVMETVNRKDLTAEMHALLEKKQMLTRGAYAWPVVSEYNRGRIPCMADADGVRKLARITPCLDLIMQQAMEESSFENGARWVCDSSGQWAKTHVATSVPDLQKETVYAGQEKFMNMLHNIRQQKKDATGGNWLLARLTQMQFYGSYFIDEYGKHKHMLLMFNTHSKHVLHHHIVAGYCDHLHVHNFIAHCIQHSGIPQSILCIQPELHDDMQATCIGAQITHECIDASREWIEDIRKYDIAFSEIRVDGTGL